MHRIDRRACGRADGRIARRAAALLVLGVLTGPAAPADAAPVVNLGVDYFVGDVLTQRIAFAAPGALDGAVAGRYVAPDGTIAAGSAAFDDGVVRGAASLVRSAAQPFAEVANAYVTFQDTLRVETGGRCPTVGAGCRLAFGYTGTGTFAVTGNPRFAGSFDVGLLDPAAPGDRAARPFDRVSFLGDGAFSISDAGSIPFADDVPLVFWLAVGFTARQLAGSIGSSVLDATHTFRFDSFGVDDNGFALPFGITSDSGLLYGPLGLVAIGAVPEPGTWSLVASGLASVALARRARRSKRASSAVRDRDRAARDEGDPPCDRCSFGIFRHGFLSGRQA